ncbi:uncharacterized protein LOC128548616 [Mercenaria mercenaria]|uniref:uncharacterized protein LOC128548616 n=1 Tax=Mercenaria mercenaria TaxID=6596 RepID=UPI00234EB706|nr:uncharacterized protein LOC128548616 [Mercenaria mercenaria]
MAGMSSDLEILKDIPGYKAILKSVLKSQIQLLIEQLSDHTGEETIILTASVHDGTLSHLGSNTGKGFLDGRDEIKSQFLAFCLKNAKGSSILLWNGLVLQFGKAPKTEGMFNFSGHLGNKASDTNENQNDDDFTEQNSENEDSTAASIKIEPITESEMELEITGVEPGKTSVSADTWGQGQVLGTSGVGEGASNETGDQGGYRRWSYPYSMSNATEPQVKKEHMSKKKVTFNLGMTTLIIPKPLHTDSLFDQGNELVDREFRNPLDEAQVKTEPVDQDEFGLNDVAVRKYWSGTQTSNHMFVSRSRSNDERTGEFYGRNHCTEVQSKTAVYRWKPGQESTTRYIDQEDKEYGEQSKKIVMDNSDIPKNGESEWKRTVIVGKRKKHTDKQRRSIREYVDDVVAQIRSQTERQNETADAVVDWKHSVPEGQNDEVSESIEHGREAVDNLTIEKPQTQRYMENQDLCLRVKGKKKKRKRSKKSKKELYSGSETKIQSQIGTVMSPKVGTNRSFAKAYLNGLGINKAGHPMVFGWKYHCPYCPMRYTTDIALKRHMWRHTKVKPYACSHCSLEFMRMKELDQHMRREHLGLPY